MQFISRNEAIANGLKRYFNGKPCPAGHVAERLVSNWGCMECSAGRFQKYYSINSVEQKQRAKEWRKRNPDKVLASKREWENDNKDKKSAYDKKSHEKYREKRLKVIAAYRKLNAARIKEITKQWKIKNHSRVLASVRSRDARKKQAIPPWANLDKIEAIYDECIRISELTGIKHHVDHIVPMKGRLVSGLHVETNLQLLEAKENLKKGNSWG